MEEKQTNKRVRCSISTQRERYYYNELMVYHPLSLATCEAPYCSCCTVRRVRVQLTAVVLYLAPSGLGTACKARAACMQRTTDSWYVRKHQHCCCCCHRHGRHGRHDRTSYSEVPGTTVYDTTITTGRQPPQQNLFFFFKYVTHFSRICLLLSEYVRLSCSRHITITFSITRVTDSSIH